MNRRWCGAVLALAIGTAAISGQAQQARIVEWVENAPAADADHLALGYPVPQPVDTPLPFDGFRSYAGLLARAQDLAASTPWVHPSVVGTSRYGREIWAYRLGDADLQRPGGAPEPAMLTNGGIHAREWQTPEIVTGILEQLVERQDEDGLYAYLRDNANVIVIPVLNVDGFLQTQRYPASNWLGTDISDPLTSPRDGRMRRKNLRGADEDLSTRADHLQGVDLNRNNAPFWNTSPGESSPDARSLVHHGPAPGSEPETQALQTAVELGPPERLALYTDVHSFSQVHFWVRNDNQRLADQTETLLRTFSDFHRAFPAGKVYTFHSAATVPRNRGIGSTDEYFTHTFEVPSWTLEVEPAHGGADYGGLGRNGHDGFILPDAEIRRVRRELAETFAIAYYRQAGPPAVAALRLTDVATGSVVYAAAWDGDGPLTRTQHTFVAQPLQLERDYRAWIAFDKPMRWRTAGKVTQLPGQAQSALQVVHEFDSGTGPWTATIGDVQWLDAPGGAPDGYRRYRDDALGFDFRLPDDADNRARLAGSAEAILTVAARDMTGLRTDADPATVARWGSGGWSGYEDDTGLDGTDTGGRDRTAAVPVTAEAPGDPFVVEPGITAAWYDPARSGEGFVLEVLADQRAVMYWFTYDVDGGQDWYLAVGTVAGNRIRFPELLRVSGGTFGPDFDPNAVTETVVGAAEFLWSGCDHGTLAWRLDGDAATPERSGRMQLTRLSRVMGLACGQPPAAPDRPEGGLSGSWYDPAHAGEGYALEVLADSRVLVYWFGYAPGGARRWFFGVGSIEDGTLVFPDLLTTRGGVFGAGFDPATVEERPWGSLELDLTCGGGTASYAPTEPGFPAGELQLRRLTDLEGLACAPNSL